MSLQMRKTMVLASDELPSTTQNSTFLWDDILYKAAIRHNMLRIASSLSHSRGRSAWGALESVELRSQLRSTAFQLLQIISFIVSSIFFGSLSPPPPFPLSTFFLCWYWCWFTSCSLTQTWNLSKNDQRIKFQVLILREALKKGIFRNIS